MKTKLLVAAISAVSATLPAVAAAASFRPTPTLSAVAAEVRVRVPVGNLDLSTPAGVQTMQHRLSAASRRACVMAFRDQALAAQQTNLCLRKVSASSRQKLAAMLATAQLATHASTQVAEGHP